MDITTITESTEFITPNIADAAWKSIYENPVVMTIAIVVAIATIAITIFKAKAKKK